MLYVLHCQLLATGLSGLYSALPRRLDYPSDDWNQFTAEDVAACPALAMFLNSLEFCNAVVQVHYHYLTIFCFLPSGRFMIKLFCQLLLSSAP